MKDLALSDSGRISRKETFSTTLRTGNNTHFTSSPPPLLNEGSASCSHSFLMLDPLVLLAFSGPYVSTGYPIYARRLQSSTKGPVPSFCNAGNGAGFGHQLGAAPTSRTRRWSAGMIRVAAQLPPRGMASSRKRSARSVVDAMHLDDDIFIDETSYSVHRWIRVCSHAYGTWRSIL